MVIQGQKYRWHLPCTNMGLMRDLAARLNVCFPIVQTLLTRGMEDIADIERFLFTQQERDVGHPSLLKDAHKAVDRIIKAIEQREKILICGDYDVDGITSSALLLTCLLPLGAQVNFFLPNRVRDGYGLSVKTVERAARNGYSVLITVDNGITAFDAARAARAANIDLIITDHHHPHAEEPDAFAIVNPHQKACSYPFKYFAGVGVGFKLMSYLYERLGLSLPKQVYELLLLGTVADVVPLKGENRFWVRYGLNQIQTEESFALKVLKKNGRVAKSELSATDIGFFLTPQINALGRLDDPRDGVKFLMSSDFDEVERIGAILASFNEARKLVERSIVQTIEQALAQKDFSEEWIIVESHHDWPAGVIGLAASRLVSSYYRPAFLFHVTAEGIAKGSCRSLPSFNVFHALVEVKDLLLSFGGHAAAAGLSLPAEKLPLFKERMVEIVKSKLTRDDLQPVLTIDAELSLSEANHAIVRDLKFLEPFGCDNPVPFFYVRGATLINPPQLLKEVHVKCTIFADGIMKPVIFFNRPELFSFLTAHVSERVDLIVHILENNWNNEARVELQGIDIALV